MKNLLFTCILTSLITFSFALPGEEESSYEGAFVSYNVEKTGSKVFINLELKNPNQYNEIKVVRSNDPGKYFRQVKYLNNETIGSLTGSDILTDEYPLPGSSPSYYKVITIDDYGVQRAYPCVKLEL